MRPELPSRPPSQQDKQHDAGEYVEPTATVERKKNTEISIIDQEPEYTEIIPDHSNNNAPEEIKIDTPYDNSWM